MSSRSDVLGRPRPRVHLAPRAATSDGEDACFLSSSYGLTADDWQEDILGYWLGRRKDGRWAAATCALAVPRQNGKNGVIEVRELFGMVALGEKFLHTAHEVKTARKAFLRIASFFENSRKHPELAELAREIRKTNGQEAIFLTNGGSIEFIARSRGSGRGFTVDVLVCDEAQDLSDEELAALLPTISAAPTGNPQVILTGTPPDSEKPGHGVVFSRVRKDGVTKDDPRLCWDDFGIADGPIELMNLDDRQTWTEANPALGIRLAVAEVERERALMSPEKFAAERLGWWGDGGDAGAIISETQWASCLRDERKMEGAPSLAIAATPDLSSAAIGAAVVSGGKTWVKVLAHGPGAAWLVDAVAEAHRQHGSAVVVDKGGPCSSLIGALEDAGVRLRLVGTGDVCDAAAVFHTAAIETNLRHMGNPELDAAVKVARWRDVGDRRAFGRKFGDITPLEAASLAAADAQANNYDIEDSFL